MQHLDKYYLVHFKQFVARCMHNKLPHEMYTCEINDLSTIRHDLDKIKLNTGICVGEQGGLQYCRR